MSATLLFELDSMRSSPERLQFYAYKMKLRNGWTGTHTCLQKEYLNGSLKSLREAEKGQQTAYKSVIPGGVMCSSDKPDYRRQKVSISLIIFRADVGLEENFTSLWHHSHFESCSQCQNTLLRHPLGCSLEKAKHYMMQQKCHFYVGCFIY